MFNEHGVANWYIGAMGYSYADWISVFYPKDMQPRNFLRYYSRIFNTVEIDSTFYGIPREDVVRRWAFVTPQEFKFCLKAPREITHDAGLVGVQEEILRFIQTVQVLGEKLGAILFQFPPSFDVEKLADLEQCLAGLPAGVRYAVEVRNPSWYTAKVGTAEPALASALRQYGVCWAATEYPGLPRIIYPTTDFIYIRWIGQHGSFQHHDHERIDRTPELMAWKDLLRALDGNFDRAFGFFNNDYAGFAAGTANRFKQLMGFEARDFSPPQQGVLF
ncbi:MAG: DUF72 domain-containing protein [Anaerolineales bacterium]|nr:DUF72 domain-containing protein [Anaerolineales bacterium]